MSHILEDLFFGELQPNVCNGGDNPQWNSYMQTMEENEELLLKVLDGRERKLFLDLVDAQRQAEGTAAVCHFVKGFRLGAKIIAASLQEGQM